MTDKIKTVFACSLAALFTLLLLGGCDTGRNNNYAVPVTEPEVPVTEPEQSTPESKSEETAKITETPIIPTQSSSITTYKSVSKSINDVEWEFSVNAQSQSVPRITGVPPGLDESRVHGDFCSGNECEYEEQEKYVSILKEDGSFIDDSGDGKLDGKHNNSESSDCVYGYCSELVTPLKASLGQGTPPWVPVVLFDQADANSSHPMKDHLDYMVLGYWATGARALDTPFGHTFYKISPDYVVTIDSNTQGIRGSAYYEGYSIGLVSMKNTQNDTVFVPTDYTASVGITADFLQDDTFNLTGYMSDIRTEIPANSSQFPLKEIFLDPIEGNLAEGEIITSPGSVSIRPVSQNREHFNIPSGILESISVEGSWDVSFHGKSNTVNGSHLPPPVVAGTIVLEGNREISQDTPEIFRLEGVFGTYKKDD